MEMSDGKSNAIVLSLKQIGDFKIISDQLSCYEQIQQTTVW